MNDFIYQEPLHLHTDVTNNGDFYKNTSIGSVALMCPECFHMTKVSIMNAIGVGYCKDIEHFNISTDYYGICSNCKEDVKFESIDINMSQIISILNNKGYYTAYCCEGHINEKEFSYPYIYFYFWEDKGILDDYPLPDTWSITEENISANIFSIYNHTHYVDKFEDDEAYNKYLEWVKTDWNQRVILESIYNWAVSLPAKNTWVKQKLKGIIDLHGIDIIDINASKTIIVNNMK